MMNHKKNALENMGKSLKIKHKYDDIKKPGNKFKQNG